MMRVTCLTIALCGAGAELLRGPPSAKKESPKEKAARAEIRKHTVREVPISDHLELPTQLTPQARLNLIKPIAWVHVPNSGVAFVNTLFNVPSICNTSNIGQLPNLTLAANELTLEQPGPLVFNHKYGHVMTRGEKRQEKKLVQDENESLLETSSKMSTQWNSLQEFVLENGVNESCSGLTSSYEWHKQQGFGPAYPEHAGKAVVLLRQPEQRILSSWYHEDYSFRKGKNVTEYAKSVSGCAVKMIARTQASANATVLRTPCDDPAPPTPAEMELATKRLVEGFAFVGIADHWTTSVGLFHKMFGGACNDFELLYDSTGVEFQTYDTDILNGFVDEYDGELYQQARTLFQSNLKRFNFDYEKALDRCKATEREEAAL